MVVGTHRVAHHPDVEGVRQPVTRFVPRLPRIPAAPDPCPAARWVARLAAVDREDKERVRLARVHHDRETEVRGQPLGARRPRATILLGAVAAPVVLGIETPGAPRSPGPLVT